MNPVIILAGLQHHNGLFSAAPVRSTGYHRAWIRDTVYATYGMEAAGRYYDVVRAMHALLNILHKHRYKIQWMIKQPAPKHSYRYIHARYDPLTGDEIHQEWGNKQHDAVGALLFRIGDLQEKGVRIVRNSQDLALLYDLVDYLRVVEYWHDPDNGMWEEAEEVHASSVGACVAGLKKIRSIIHVADDVVRPGELALQALLPSESATREADLALLSLIYPYNVVSENMKQTILRNVENQLVRERGVIRYSGDQYYWTNAEAEWTLGLAWLAIIYGNVPHKYRFFMEKLKNSMTENGELPELYFGNSAVHNENTPLGWAQSLMIVADSSQGSSPVSV